MPQDLLDQQLGFGAGDQRRRPHLELQAAKLLRAQNKLERFTRSPSPKQLNRPAPVFCRDLTLSFQPKRQA